MTATPSTMLPLGTGVPPFALPDLDGRIVSSDAYAGQPLLVAFLCPHCPFVRHVREAFGRFAREYGSRGLAIVGINANDEEAFPEDGVDGMRREAQAAGYDFPYLSDESQVVARAYRAACTPDLFLFERGGALAYRGQFDDSRPRSAVPVTGADLRAAADAVLEGRPVPAVQRPSLGCNIKWKPGNAPDYFGTPLGFRRS
jgi:thiol-disulfide isomerase/thioredoxin